MVTRRGFIVGASTCVAGCVCTLGRASSQDVDLAKVRMCTELVMRDVKLASALANNENPKNQFIDGRDAGAEALSLTQKRWHPQRKVLNVDFIETPAYIDKIIKFASRWHESMTLRFQFGRGNPDILVSFEPGGSWSYIGTDSQYYSRKGVASMNFGWFDDRTSDEEFRRTTVHEFGHALSLIHEHQHPSGGISWKIDAVYAYYKKLGWDKDAVDNNIFRKYEVGQVNGSAYDRTSIMHYPIAVELVTNPAQAVGWNTDLSAIDRQVISSLYSAQSGVLPN